MTRHNRSTSLLTGLLAAGLTLAACGDDGSPAAERATSPEPEPVIDPGDGGDYAPEIDPAAFVDGIDNPWLPFRPGARWVYEGRIEGAIERIEVTVLDERRDVEGIAATVVRDRVTIDGELVEDTYDWYAQDRAGDVWYLGEDTREYEGGEVVSTEGAWESGIDGARAGVIMRAEPTVGDAYRQEFYPSEAEDLAEIVRTGETASVAAGRYDDLVTIEEWTPLEPEVVEEKSYAAGVGLVLEEKVVGGEGRIELVEHTPAS